MRKQSYCSEMVHALNRDRFLLCLFAPVSQRESMLAIYALDTELAHVHAMVSEEMIGHIRYAWWQEGLQAILDRAGLRAHPVLEALPPAMALGCLKLVELYRTQYPALPQGAGALADALAEDYLKTEDSGALVRFLKARRLIDSHRTRYGAGRNSWLHIKLLMAGAR